MIIKCLTENTALNDKFDFEHGLSLYIETKHHKILFDLGKTDVFYKNAQRLNVDLKEIDTVVISHGHNDHGGGLEYFLNINKKAKIYIQENAFETHLSIHEGVSKDIGLDKSLKNNKQIVLLRQNLKIDDELFIFKDVKTHDLIAKSNNNLYKKVDDVLSLDDFEHEQNLIIHEDNNYLLIAGCAHRGIVNILRRANELTENNINYCIGGFHLSSPRRKTRESDEMIDAVIASLMKTKTQFYTCHCTGLEVYSLMKNKMLNQLNYICAGTILKI